MKKKIVGAALVVMMGLNLAACGGKDDTAVTVPEVSVSAETPADNAASSEQAVTAESTVAVEAEEGFTLLDVTTDMIQAGIYTTDEQQEQVIALFEGPDGANYICVMQVFADETGDVICGAYDDTGVEAVTTEDGTIWTVVSFTDVYTDTDCTVVFAEFDDGSVMVANSDFTIAVEGAYLTADETIDYMAAAVNYIAE